MWGRMRQEGRVMKLVTQLLWGLVLQELQIARGIGGAPQLEPHAMGAVEGECGVKGGGASRKHLRTDD